MMNKRPFQHSKDNMNEIGLVWHKQKQNKQRFTFVGGAVIGADVVIGLMVICSVVAGGAAVAGSIQRQIYQSSNC